MSHEKETRKVPVPTDEEALAFAEAISQTGSAIEALRQIQAGLHERRYEEYDWIALLARCEGETKDFACPPVAPVQEPAGTFGEAYGGPEGVFTDYQDPAEDIQAWINGVGSLPITEARDPDEARLEAEGEWERTYEAARAAGKSPSEASTEQAWGVIADSYRALGREQAAAKGRTEEPIDWDALYGGGEQYPQTFQDPTKGTGCL